MARAGAHGVASEEMDAALRHFGADDNAEWVAGLGAALDARNRIVEDGGGTPREVIVRSVNAPFAQDGFPIEPAYLEALAQRFGGGVRLLDFVRDTEGAHNAINGWVGDQTEDRVPELLAQVLADYADWCSSTPPI